MLRGLATETDAAVASSHCKGKLTSERFRIKFINGKQYNYVWCNFSPMVRSEYIPQSAIFLLSEIAHQLSPETLKLLHRAMCMFVAIASEYKLEAGTNQVLAHASVQRALSMED